MISYHWIKLSNGKILLKDLEGRFAFGDLMRASDFIHSFIPVKYRYILDDDWIVSSYVGAYFFRVVRYSCLFSQFLQLFNLLV